MRQAADIYMKAFTEEAKWTAAWQFINIVDCKHLAVLFRCFTDHDSERYEVDYDKLYKSLPITTQVPKQSYMDYDAAPSLQRRRIHKTPTTPTPTC